MSKSPNHRGTIMDPMNIPDPELLKMPLKTLSKTISLTTPSQLTISIYLRWLEVHRQEPSKLSEHWSNTLLHWSQSLKSRGFRLNELIADVEDWKEQQKKERGPFRSYERRYPPMPADIRRAFGEEDAGWDKTGHLPDGFLQPPPKGYVCNRCGQKGHHLQVCPTNLDPEYDRPPDHKYVCTCCQARGQHYRSLCPRNTDPNSIFQRRKARGIVTPGIDISDHDSQREFNRMRGEKRERGRDYEGSNSSTPDKKARLMELDSEKERLVIEEIEDVHDIGLLTIETRQASGNHKRELSTARNGREKFRKTGCVDLTASPAVEDFRRNAIGAHYNLNPDEVTIPEDDFTDSPSDQLKKDLRHCPSSSHLSDSDSSRIDGGMATTPPTKPKKQYCYFVRQLRKKYPEMKETVHQIKKRPTAVDMMNRDFERQLEQEKPLYRSPTPIYHKPNQSKEATPNNPESQDNEHRTPRRPLGESEYYESKEYPQLDGALDEKPEDYNRGIPRRSNKFSCFRKGAIGKVKNITNAAKDLSTFKPKSRSSSPSLAKGNPATVSQSRLFPFSSRESSKKPLSEKSPNHRLVPAITSALKLTSPTFESLHEDSRALLKPDTPTESLHVPEVVATTPTLQSPDKRSTPTYRSSKSLHSASTETFETSENEAGRCSNPRAFKGLHSRRVASVTPTRSTDEFRHTVRKMIIEGTKAEEFRTFSKTFKLSTPMPADIAVLTKRPSSTQMSINGIEGTRYPYGTPDNKESIALKAKDPVDITMISGSGNPMINKMNSDTNGTRNNALSNYPLPPHTKRSAEQFSKYAEANMAREKKGLKQFSKTFKLSTPIPSDIAFCRALPAKQMEQPRQQSCEIFESEA